MDQCHNKKKRCGGGGQSILSRGEASRNRVKHRTMTTSN